MGRPGGADDIGCPAESPVRQGSRLMRGHRQEVSRENRGAALGRLAQCLQSGLGHTGIGEDDGPAGGAKGGLDRGNLRRRDFDQRGERADDPGLEELRTVEPPQDRLRPLSQTLTLALQLEKDLQPMIPLGKLLARGIPFRLGKLACLLGGIVCLLGGDEFLLGGIQRLTRGGLGKSCLLGSRGGCRDCKACEGDLLLKLQGALTLGIPARAGSGELSPDIGETVFQLVESADQRVSRLFRGLALLLGLLKSCRSGLKRFLLGAQDIQQRGELCVGLLDFALLFADAQMRGIHVSLGADAHFSEFPTTLGVGLDAAFSGKDPVAQGLKLITGAGNLGVEGGDLFARTGDLALLLGDFPLVEGAGLGALLDLLRHLGDGAFQIKIGAVREMGVEHTEILHERLVTTGLTRLSLERADLALHLLDDIGDTQEIGLGVFQLAERLFLLSLVLCDAGGFLEDGATILGTAVEELRRPPLLHDGVGAATDARIHEKIVDILEPAGGAVDQVFRFAIAENTAGDAHFVPVNPKLLLTLGKGHRDFGHVVRLPGIGAIENDIGHFSTAQRLGRLLAEHPADGIQHIRLTAPVRADNRGHSTVKAEDRLGGKRLETDQFEGLKIHEKICEIGPANARRDAAFVTLKKYIKTLSLGHALAWTTRYGGHCTLEAGEYCVTWTSLRSGLEAHLQ